MMWMWMLVARAEPDEKPVGCRPPEQIQDALRTVMKPLRACLRGASFRPEGPVITIAPAGTVTIETNTDNPARDVCANEVLAELKLPELECTVIVSYPFR